MLYKFLAATALLLPVSAEAHGSTANLCATPEQTENVRNYYSKLRPGVPLPVASRYFNLPEAVIASALPDEAAVGAVSSLEVADQIWRSIDTWGATTKVSLVLAPNGKNSFAFPSLVPITQDDSNDGYLDVYADGGKGVHSHIQISDIAAIYAHDVPNGDGKNRTRGISFFGQTGDLILGVYASIKADPFDQKAVTGFHNTWRILKDMKQPC